MEVQTGGMKKMADSNNNFKSTVEALFKGMDAVVSSKTVVGDAIHINDTIILPLVDVSFGIGAGSSSADKKEKGMGKTRIQSQKFLIWFLMLSIVLREKMNV